MSRQGDLHDGWPLISGMKFLLAICGLCNPGSLTWPSGLAWPHPSVKGVATRYYCYRPSYHRSVSQQACYVSGILHVCMLTTYVVMTDHHVLCVKSDPHGVKD